MYPDAFVRCGPRDDRRTTTDDPVVVFEVLSEGTVKHDLIRKRLAYESIPGLRRIVYVSVDEMRLDMRVRSADGIWGDETVEGWEAVVELPEIGSESACGGYLRGDRTGERHRAAGVRVAIVGAGMAGAACARALADAGMTVRLFDKGRSVGGRLAQRRVEQGVFDHGAQYFRARDPAFMAAIEGWRAQGIVTYWPGAAGSDGGGVLVGVPAMSAPVKALLADLPVATGSRITKFGHATGGWTLSARRIGGMGRSRAVLVAVPAPQAADLLATAGERRCRGPAAPPGRCADGAVLVGHGRLRGAACRQRAGAASCGRPARLGGAQCEQAGPG